MSWFFHPSGMSRAIGFSKKLKCVYLTLFSVTHALSVTHVFANALPDYYQEPGFNHFRDVNIGALGETIDPFHGGLQFHVSPFRVPGNGGLDIEVQLTYRSIAKQATQFGPDHKSWPSPFGIGWDFHMGRIWPGSKPCPGKNSVNGSEDFDAVAPVLELADGTRRALLAYTGEGDFDLITKDRWAAQCDDLNNRYVVYSPEGVKYIFPKTGHSIAQGSGVAYSVESIMDPSGNTIDVQYLTDDNYELVSQVSFKNQSNSTVTIAYEKVGSYYRLQSMSSNSQTWKFTLNTVPNVGRGYFLLNKISPTGINGWAIEYGDTSGTPDHYNIVKTVSPTGVQTDYSYVTVSFDGSFGMQPQDVAIKTKSTSGADTKAATWAYAYNPGSATDNGVTTITTPIGTEKHTYYPSLRPDNGDVWRVGTLLKQEWLQGNTLLKRVVYDWAPDFISTMQVRHRRRPGDAVRDVDTWTPRLVSRESTLHDGDQSVQFKTEYLAYDAYSNPTRIRETGYDDGASDSRTRELTYDVKLDHWILRLVSKEQFDGESVDGESGAIERTYDDKGRLTKVSEFGASTTYTRCSTHGGINEVTNANGNVTHFMCEKYEKGVPKEEFRANNDSSHRVAVTRLVDDHGRVTSETIADGIALLDGTTQDFVTKFEWDELNRLKKINTSAANDSNVSISWNKQGTLRTLKRGTFTQSSQYDGLGRLLRETNPEFYVRYEYDQLGRQVFASNPIAVNQNSSLGTDTTYDVIGRVKKQNPPGAGEITFDYQNNNTVRITDQLGHATSYRYRSYEEGGNRQLMRIIPAQASSSVSINSTIIKRDVWDFMTSVSQGGVTRDYAYNDRKHLISLTHPEVGTVKYGRDTMGNMTSLQINEGDTTTYGYTALEQLASVSYQDPQTPDEFFTYTKTGQIKTATTQGQIEWSYGYNLNNLLSQETLTLLAGSPINAGVARQFKVRYQYDAMDRRTNIIYPSRINYEFTNDALGRPNKLRFLNGQYLMKSARYWPSGQLRQLIYGNNKTTQFDQGELLKPTTSLTGDVDPDDQNALDGLSIVNPLADERYQYNGKGLLTALSDAMQPEFGFTAFGYDTRDRLTHLNGVERYTYDGNHNILSNTVANRNFIYQYDANQRLTGIANSPYSNFSYDDRGNVVDNTKEQFQFDEASRLRSVINRNWTFNYDAHGKRVYQNKPGGAVIAFYGLEGRLLFEWDEQANQQRDYLYVGNQMVTKIQRPLP